VSAIQLLAPGQPAAARCGEDTAAPGGLPADGPSLAGRCCALQVLAGRPDQVGVARRFVGECLAAHPAADDARLVASELAANSVVHSASRFGGGWFLIRVVVLDTQHAAVTVTDQGGVFEPKPAAPDGASGRGLAVVRSLACLFSITDHDDLRTFTAVIPAAGSSLPDPLGVTLTAVTTGPAEGGAAR
jgi:anti-sigma regulatory factor (Ser/Thr protein kinase)